MADFRIDVGFFQHPKTRKLRRRLGGEGVTALLQLWAFAAVNRTRGTLDNLDHEDIADAADWQGDPEEFVEALTRLRWLDRPEGGPIALHDWRDHQPYLYHAQDRSAQAKRAAEKRWTAKQAGCGKSPHKHADSEISNADSMRTALLNHEISNAPLPLPLPDPDPEEKRVGSGGGSTNHRGEVNSEGRPDRRPPSPNPGNGNGNGNGMETRPTRALIDLAQGLRSRLTETASEIARNDYTHQLEEIETELASRGVGRKRK